MLQAIFRKGASARVPALTPLLIAVLALIVMPTLAQQPPAPPPALAAVPQASAAALPAEPSSATQSAEVSEDALKQLLVGKTFYLRGGYLDDSLSFNEHGAIIGISRLGSYTLCMVEIERVHLTKHKVELEGVRYGLHFLGALPYEDPSTAIDHVRITPKKKILRITIDREQVVKPKKVKEEKAARGAAASQPASTSSASSTPPEPSDEDQLKAEIAAAPEAERPAEPGSVTTTTSPQHAANVLKQAIDNIFASGLDARMMAAMPDFWKLYYQAAAAKTDFKPSDPAVQRQGTVDRKARLLTNIEAESNDYAQQAGIAGMALYHAVVGADGAAQEIAVARPIGFGLDENAVAAIRKAKFEPAMKAGKPVPVMLDLVVEFRIYSKLTSEESPTPSQPEKPAAPPLPGPYSLPPPH